MSTISDLARVQLFIADYAVQDASSKINALGIGFQVALLQPTASTTPQALVALIEVPPGHAGEDLAVELALYDDGDLLVEAHGPLGQLGSPIRFAQNVTLQAAAAVVPGYRIPRSALWTRHQLVVSLQNGVPLTPGRGYEWRVSLDTVTRPDWAIGFYVPAPAGGVVVG